MALITKAEYKELYDITDTALDTKIDSMILYAQDIANSFCGYNLEESTYTKEKHDGGVDSILLDNYPVTNVSEVLIDSNSSSNWTLYNKSALYWGVNRHSSIDVLRVFPPGMQNIEVTYTAGYTSTTVPGDLKLAILKLTKVVMSDKKANANNLTRQTLHGETREFASGKKLSYVDDTIQDLLLPYKKW